MSWAVVFGSWEIRRWVLAARWAGAALAGDSASGARVGWQLDGSGSGTVRRVLPFCRASTAGGGWWGALGFCADRCRTLRNPRRTLRNCRRSFRDGRRTLRDGCRRSGAGLSNIAQALSPVGRWLSTSGRLLPKFAQGLPMFARALPMFWRWISKRGQHASRHRQSVSRDDWGLSPWQADPPPPY